MNISSYANNNNNNKNNNTNTNNNVDINNSNHIDRGTQNRDDFTLDWFR